MKDSWEMLKANLEKEITCFLMLSSEKDVKFLDIPKRKRKTEDYVRLMCITMTFGFKGAFLKLAGEAGNRIDEICSRLEELKKEPETVRKWLDDFVAQIRYPDAKALAEKHVAEKFAEIENGYLDISYLFK